MKEQTELSKTDSWLAQARSGSEEAFARLAVHFGPLIRQQAQRLHTDAMGAEDLEQEGLLGLLGAVRSFKAQNGAAFSTYAYVCIRHRMISALRRVKPSPANLSLEENEEDERFAKDRLDPAQVVQARDEEAELDKRLRNLLTPLEYDVLRLHMGGYTYGEIAQRLQIGQKSVDNALQRIRLKLSH